MDTPEFVAAGPRSIPPRNDTGKRNRRWLTFRIIFACTYVGIVLDIVTTAMGFQRAGKAYEQNPMGSAVIADIGWIGLFLLLTALAAVCYFSFRLVCYRMSTRWSALLNALLAVVAAVRWLAVITALMYLADTSH